MHLPHFLPLTSSKTTLGNLCSVAGQCGYFEIPRRQIWQLVWKYCDFFPSHLPKPHWAICRRTNTVTSFWATTKTVLPICISSSRIFQNRIRQSIGGQRSYFLLNHYQNRFGILYADTVVFFSRIFQNHIGQCVGRQCGYFLLSFSKPVE